MAIGTRRHRLLTGEDVGSLVRWTVADSTARLALLLTADDNGCVARQTDDNSYHILAAYATPTWVQLGATVNVISSANAPTVNDDELDGYEVGSLWIRTAAGSEAFYCLADATAGAAVWVLAAGGGAAATWGTITGTLSAQTDLQNALDAKKPLELSGAGAPGVSTGNGLTLGTIYVDTTADASYTLVDATTDANVWSAGGGGSWGSITGTLSDQTDLQAALDAKVAGPASAIDESIARFDGVTGKLLKDGGTGTLTDQGHLKLTGTAAALDLKEMASAPAFQGGTGHHWVKNDSPTTPQFTDDVGTDHQLAYKANVDDNELQGSIGTISGGVITDGGAGTINISEWTGWLRSSNSDTAPRTKYTIAAQTGVALTDNATNFVLADYNAGSPTFTALTAPVGANRTYSALGAVYREGTTLHISNVNWHPADYAQVNAVKDGLTAGFLRQNGSATSEQGNRQLAVTAGNWWLAANPFALAAKDTSVADTFSYFYSDGVGGFTEVTAQTTIDNLQYDDGSGVLATLANNRYGVHWLYQSIDDALIVVYGTDSYTLAAAEGASIPASLPGVCNPLHSVLLARIIVAKSGTNLTEIAAPFEDTFSRSAASVHSELSGLAVDDHTQYLLADGSRALSGNLSVAALATIDGRDLSVDGAKLDGIETAADVTDTANVTAAGALMDSEVDADLKTFALPANTTISAFGATLVDDADAATARTTLGAGDVVGPASATSGAVALFDGTTGKLLKDLGATFTAASGGRLYVGMTNAYMRMKEKASAATFAANFGDWWVRDDAPNTPMFTNDTGVDTRLNKERDITLASNEFIDVDATEVVIGGGYLDGSTGGTYSWEILAEYNDNGGTGVQDLDIYLYDRGPDGTPVAGVLRSTLSVDTLDTLDRVSLTLTASASPGTDTDTIYNTARLYEVRAKLDAGGGVDTARILSVRFIES